MVLTAELLVTLVVCHRKGRVFKGESEANIIMLPETGKSQVSCFKYTQCCLFITICFSNSSGRPPSTMRLCRRHSSGRHRLVPRTGVFLFDQTLKGSPHCCPPFIVQSGKLGEFASYTIKMFLTLPASSNGISSCMKNSRPSAATRVGYPPFSATASTLLLLPFHLVCRKLQFYGNFVKGLAFPVKPFYYGAANGRPALRDNP